MIIEGYDTQPDINPGIYDLVGSIDLCSTNAMTEMMELSEINTDNTPNSMELFNAEDS